MGGCVVGVFMAGGGAGWQVVGGGGSDAKL